MADAEKRQQEVQDEFGAEKGDDVLVLDWTRDAAARCGREWLFNAMDGQHIILCSELTTACKPADVSHILRRLFDRGVKPKVTTLARSAAVPGRQWSRRCGQTL